MGLIAGSWRVPWRRAWQPTPAFLPGESHGQRSLVGYGPQGHKETDTTEATEHTHMLCVGRERGTQRASTPRKCGFAPGKYHNFWVKANHDSYYLLSRKDMHVSLWHVMELFPHPKTVDGIISLFYRWGHWHVTQSGESHAYTLDLCSGGFQLTSELLFATMLSLQMPKTSHWSWYLILTFRGKKAIKLAFTCSCDWPINILQNILPERYNLRTGNVTREFSCNHSNKKKK